MSELEDLRRHIAFKRDSERSLKPVLAEHMLEALDRGEAPDYQALLRAACASFEAGGLTRSQPGKPETGSPWSDPLGVWASQPAGVYVAEVPDLTGRWSRWDVWRVDVADLTWSPDLLNQRCWVLDHDVEPGRLTLHEARDI